MSLTETVHVRVVSICMAVIALATITYRGAFAQTVEDGFDPGTDNSVNALAQQVDGKVIVAGAFSTLGGQPSDRFGRLYPDGTIDWEN